MVQRIGSNFYPSASKYTIRSKGRRGKVLGVNDVDGIVFQQLLDILRDLLLSSIPKCGVWSSTHNINRQLISCKF